MKSATPTTTPPIITSTTWMISALISLPADAPMARSTVSEPVFCTVRIRKNRPVVSSTTNHRSPMIRLKELRTSETPGDCSSAWARVSGSVRGTASRMRAVSSSALTPSAGSSTTALGCTAGASGLRVRLASCQVA